MLPFLFFIFFIYNYLISSKIEFNFNLAIVESFLMLLMLIYFFFEKIKYDIQVSLYDSKIFWISAILFIFFAGNLFLFLYANTINSNKLDKVQEEAFKNQYKYIYNSFNIFKNIFLVLTIIIKTNADKDFKNNGAIETPFDNFYPVNNQN